MAIAGRVAIVPKGDWSADATYKRLDAVTYNNTLYFAKKDVPAGTATSNTEYWSKSIVGGAGAIATTEEAGIVKPDGKSMSVDESGTLSINLDGTTITLDEAKNVIKLADTLKDAINGAFPAANVANNQITTVEGFALDARQANPNLDGTLAKQISDLNGSLNKSRMDCLWTGKASNMERVDFSNPISNYPSARMLIFVFHYDETNFECTFDLPIFDLKNRTNFLANNTEVALSIIPPDQIFDTFCSLKWTSTKDYYLKSVYIEY